MNKTNTLINRIKDVDNLAMAVWVKSDDVEILNSDDHTEIKELLAMGCPKESIFFYLGEK